jgi:hypothetical protein
MVARSYDEQAVFDAALVFEQLSYSQAYQPDSRIDNGI